MTLYHRACPKVSPDGYSCRGDVQYDRVGDVHWLRCLTCGWRLDSLIERPRPIQRTHDDEAVQGMLVELAG